MAADYDGDIKLSVGLDPEDVVSSANKMSKSIGAIFKKAAGKQLSSSVQNVLSSLDKANSKIVQSRRIIDENMGKQVNTDAYQKIIDKIKEYQKEQDKAVSIRDRLESKANKAGEGSAVYEQYIKARDAVGEYGRKLYDANEAKKRLEQTGAAKLNWEDSAEGQRIIQTLNESTNAATRLIQKLREAKDESAKGLVTSPWERLKERIRGATSAVGGFIRNTASTAFHGISTKVRGIASSFAQLASQKIKSGLSKLTSRIFGLDAAAKRANGTFNKLKRLFLMGLGIRGLFGLFSRLRSVVTQGFQEIAKSVEPFNDAMSNLKSSTGQMKGQIAATFAQLAMTIMPILNTIINAINTVLAKIAQLVAALSGQTTFMRATKTQQNYAGALSDTGSAAEDTKKQLMGFDDVNILQEDKSGGGGGGGGAGAFGIEEAAIDERITGLVDKIKQFIATEDWYGLGNFLAQKINSVFQRAYSALTSNQLYEKIHYVITAIVTTLNSLIQNIDWNLIGRTFAAGLNLIIFTLNDFLANINWNTLGSQFAEGIRGFVTELNWTELGSLLGNYLNMWIRTAAGFLANFPWSEVGSNIATGLNTSVETINWNAIAVILIAGINGVVDMWYEFVTTFDFYKFGSHIGETLSNAIRNIDWEKGGASVAQTINGLFETLNGFIESTDWEELGRSVIDFIAGFFDEFDWAEVGTFISNCVTSLSEFFTGLVQEVEWEEIPNKIVEIISELLSGVNWDESASQFSEFMGSLVAVIATALVTALKLGFDILKMVKDRIVECFKNAGWDSDNTLEENGKAIMEGLKNGVTSGLKSIRTWLDTNVLKPFVNGFETVFEIGSPSKVMEKEGEYLTDGVYNGASNASTWDKINGVFEKGCAAIVKLFTKEDWEDSGEKITEGIKTGVETTSKWTLINSIFTKEIGAVKNLVSSEEPNFSNLGSNLTSKLSAGLDTVKQWATIYQGFDRGLTAIKNLINQAPWQDLGRSSTDKLRNAFNDSGIWYNITSKFTQEMNNIRNAITSVPWWNIASSVTSTLYNAFSSLNLYSVGQSMIGGLLSGINSMYSSISSVVSSMCSSITARFRAALQINSPSKVMIPIGGGITEGVAKGIEEQEPLAMRALQGVADSIGNSTFTVPDVAAGRVTPYMSASSTGQLARTLQSALGSNDNVTNTSLTAMMQDVITAVNRIQFYIGDEQIARHAASGNKKLDRRFNPVTAEV